MCEEACPPPVHLRKKQQEQIFTRRRSAAERNPAGRAEGKMVCLQEPVEEGGRVHVVNQGAPPPQRRGPVNLVNDEWAPGQMTHRQSSINTAAQGRQGRCYRWGAVQDQDQQGSWTASAPDFIKMRKVPA